MNRLPTIRDVAKYARVSPTTVSCILNHKLNFNFSKTTVERINKAIEELGYSPNNMVKSLQNGKTNTIGLGYFKIPNLSEMFQYIINAVSEKSDYDVMFYLGEKVIRGTDIVNPIKFLDGRIDGVIFNESLRQNASEYLGKKNFPTVVLLKSNVPDGVASANSDYYEIACKAVKYLWSLGHRNIAHLAANVNDWEDALRTMQGYAFTMKKNNPGFNDDWLFIRNSVDTSLLGKTLEKWLAMPAKIRPTAIFTDMPAGAKLLEIAPAKGIKVPEDISIMCVGNCYDRYAHLTPRLSSFTVSQTKIAEYAVSSLIAIINGENPEDWRTFVPYGFIAGETVTKLRKKKGNEY
ncbi:MAG: Transcriptional regulator, LacI family [Candidatus Uhrbacteria bacterium GW2011_GWF2_39_13]|uniref:Transcriptional regulator, LacI family n=1 Tax=Candidatus Uhrbacteria bacterium GW2011_GWF2_39_13 TaxID=1618995 RepID=A0A0G0MK56_9BACT|nr:MAG: Transcriptional regulator, LacI family [Candidatus Uhrbacteria bacterium GW2011_GWF2_39_13]